MISFILMVGVGLGNKIFQKLQTIPMSNYPNYLNLMTTFVYIPASFAYIIPMMRYGRISQEELNVPKKTFAVMGVLDGIAGIMQIFAATYLPGTLLILLSQAAIPVSMIITKALLKVEYKWEQYIGAFVVAAGIACVLGPKMGDAGDGKDIPLWSGVMILSCVPMCLSSVYKELALGDTEMDPVYMNGWIAVFQFLISIPLAVPSAIAGDPRVYPDDLPENLWDGLLCYGGSNSITAEDVNDDSAIDDCWPMAPIYVSIYLVFNILYNILIIIIIKHGSSNMLWLAMTIMVPLGNIAFTLDFMPDKQTLKVTDIVGLVIIMAGLIFYRYWAELEMCIMGHSRAGAHAGEGEEDIIDPLLEEGHGVHGGVHDHRARSRSRSKGDRDSMDEARKHQLRKAAAEGSSGPGISRHGSMPAPSNKEQGVN